MGATVSSEEENSALVDNLVVAKNIRTERVEEVFRAVDRADYVFPSQRNLAYKDDALECGHIRLSSPSIYCEVMESLMLEPGMSFLNIGSGTGYLSTMAGLILGLHGINHGIELYKDCVEYANKKLKRFKRKSVALDKFDFCEPRFIQGNCLNVTPDRQYNRVYCGAECPESYKQFIKQFVRVGGILVIPVKNYLISIQRVAKDVWVKTKILPALFHTLIVPTASERTTLHLPEFVPLSLQELCRGSIRNHLRKSVWKEMPARKMLATQTMCTAKNVPIVFRDPLYNNDSEISNNSDSSDICNHSFSSDNSDNSSNSSETSDLFSDEESLSSMRTTKDSEYSSNSTQEESMDQIEFEMETIDNDSINANADTEMDLSISENESSSDKGSGSEGNADLDCETDDQSCLTNTLDVDDDEFSISMRNKIRQLPLPDSLKLYINYNRKL